MGALELSRIDIHDVEVDGMLEAYHAHELLHELAVVYSQMSPEIQARVYKRVVSSGALPISRDTPSYVAVMSVLHGGAAGQLEYVATLGAAPEGFGDTIRVAAEEDANVWDSRAEAKRASAERMAAYQQAKVGGGVFGDPEDSGDFDVGFGRESKADEAESKSGQEPSAFEIAVAVANAADMRLQEAKEAKSEAKLSGGSASEYKGSGFRLLGDLPSLGPRYDLCLKIRYYVFRFSY